METIDMDAAYRNATAHRDRLAAEINETQQRLDELRHKLAVVDGFLRQWAEFAGGEAGIQAVDSMDTATGSARTPKLRPKNPPKEEVIESVLDILRERGEPMSRAELFAALQQRGIILEGTDPQMVLSTMLWRMQAKVVRLPKNLGYWPADQRYEPAGYVPVAEMAMTYAALSAAIAAADKAYYENDAPTVDDATYDMMRRQLAEIEKQYPQLAPPLASKG